MSAAATSRDAYAEHRDSGVLVGQQRQIMLWFHGEHKREATRSEIAESLRMRLSSVCGRCNELVDLGYLEDAPRRKCSVTGRAAHPLRIPELKKPEQLSLLEAVQ